MKSILFLIFIAILSFSSFTQNGTCAIPLTEVQNVGNSTSPAINFTDCMISPIESSGKIVIYTTVKSSPDGTLGLVQDIKINSICNDEASLLSNRIAELFIANDCPGIPINPSATIAHTYNSTTFNPEWTGLLAATNYTVRITINVPSACSGSISEVCLNQYYPHKYKCQTVDFSLSSFTNSFQCTDPKVSLLADNPPDYTTADKWIYAGFIIRVWSLPGYSWSNNQKLTFIDNGSVVMDQIYNANPMVWGIDHVQPGSYAFGITNIGLEEFGYEIVNGADGKVVESGVFKSGNTESGPYSPIGTSNYTITRVGAGAIATGVSNDPFSGGDGFFDPSISGEGTFDITYSWDNGAGCIGTSIAKQVVVTCPTPSCGTVKFNWKTGSAPSNLDCTNNTDYELKANVIGVAGDYIAPGFNIGDGSGGINYSKIEIEEGAGTGFVDVLGQKILTFCVPTLQYQIKLTGSGSGIVVITDHATGKSIYSKAFTSGMIITLAPNTILGTATFSGPGVSNYKLANPTVIGSGYGVFNPFGLTAGVHNITYSWNNGLGCSDSFIIPVTITCTNPPVTNCGTVKFNWKTGSAPSNLDCTNNTDYELKANVIGVAGDYIAPGFNIGDGSGGINYSKIEIEEGAGTGFVDVLGQKILTFCVPTLQYQIKLTGSGSGIVVITDHATGKSIYSKAFTSGMIITLAPNTILGTATFSGPGVSNYKLANPTVIGSGYGVFNPFGLTAGVHNITYSWNNGLGCSDSFIIPVTVTCATPPIPVCPTDITFAKVDWTALNFISAFTPTAFNCTDGVQQIWKNPEPSITTNGEIQTSPGFNANILDLDGTNSSVLVSVNGVPYSYYGNNAPANVINWGPLQANYDIIEPFIPGGATVTLSICDTRAGVQNIPYTVYDHVTGAVLTSGSVSVNGNCQTVTFTVVAPTITWDIDGDPTKITTNNDGSASFDPSSLSAGTHTINYSYDNNHGCTIPLGSATQSITINPLIKPSSTAALICSGTSTTLTASGATTYNWYDAATVGNKVGGSSTFITPVLLSPTSYWVSSGTGSCESARLKVDVTFKPDIIPTFPVIPNLCQNVTVPPLPENSINSIDGTWNVTNVNTATPGKTTYTFTPTPTVGKCAITKTIEVTIDPKVTPEFTLSNDICINTATQTLPLKSDNAINGSWNPATINTLVSGSTTYLFTPSPGQCTTSVSETITVHKEPIANATPNTVSGQSVLDVNFTNLSSNATSLTWDFGNGETSTTIGDNASSYTNVGSYNVVLTASNFVCPNSVWTTIITVLPIDPLTFNIPNIFTPNNDGVNDQYFIELENAASFEATIFNRWGNEMISQNKINEKWDGKTSSGKMSDEGVYYIKYKITGLDTTIKEGVAFFHLQN